MRKFQNHVCLRRDRKRALDSKRNRRQESKSGIVRRVAQHAHDPMPKSSALVQAPSDQCRTDALPLKIGCHGNRGECECMMPPANRDRTESNIRDNATINLGDRRDGQRICAPQCIHQIRLSGASKGGMNQCPDCGNIRSPLVAYGYNGLIHDNASKNAFSFPASRRSSVRTLLHKSSPNGSTAATASATLPAVIPPARKSGTRTASRIRRLVAQS